MMEPSEEKELKAYKEEGRLWQEISLWLLFNKLLYSVYDKLSDSLKNVFYDCCILGKTTSERQREDLTRALFLAGNSIAARGSLDPIKEIYAEYKDRLRPLTEKEKEDFLAKF